MNAKALTFYSDKYNVQSIAQADEVLFTEMCINGNELAFNQLFAKYYNSLLLYAQSISKCHMDAEEIVNDVFFKFWESKDKINHYLNVKYYLKVSVRNRAIDLIRKNKKMKLSVFTQTNEELALVKHHAIASNALDDMCSKESCEKIENLVNKIPTKAKEIFKMSKYDGMKYREIAEQLNISVKTVETQMTRSLATLRRELVGGN
ncbi:MAG TPA: RNA polymerase sigma-70 factor [Saprospiraceae bacterium]|nr:RNA polymerase sigma-70 factor [Saprospiraceae bacterium]